MAFYDSFTAVCLRTRHGIDALATCFVTLDERSRDTYLIVVE